MMYININIDQLFDSITIVFLHSCNINRINFLEDYIYEDSIYSN